jgi:hypothetical protein
MAAVVLGSVGGDGGVSWACGSWVVSAWTGWCGGGIPFGLCWVFCVGLLLLVWLLGEMRSHGFVLYSSTL